MVMQLGNRRSAPHQLTMGLPQGSPLSPLPFNVYTKGLADLNQNGSSKILTLADDGPIYKTSKDSQEAAEAVQQLDSVSKWCHDTGSLINPDKTQTLWCTLSTEQQANQSQRSQLMELWSNEQIILYTLGSSLTEC